MKFLYRNQYDMPVYIDNEGTYWLDADCREGHGALCTFWENDPNDTPDMRMPPSVECIFEPERIVDPADTELKMIYYV